MKEFRREALDEWWVEDRLPGGLTATVWPKRGYRKVYAVVGVRFGSLDCRVRTGDTGEWFEFPAGIAHFLEHQLFEGPGGGVFAQYAARGASANAFTGHERTAYLFSATDDVSELLDVLLEAVLTPRFTEATVSKEKSVITQEIMMYRDHPDWQCHQGLLQAMYRRHPVRTDIAGTAESVAAITKDDLERCHGLFYHPSNMRLVVAGGVEPKAVLEHVRNRLASRSFPPFRAPEREKPEEPKTIVERERRIRLPVSMPRCMIGWKSAVSEPDGIEPLRREIAVRLVLEATLGKSTDFYDRLYREGLATDVFSADFHCGTDYAHVVVGGETPDPDAWARHVRDEIRRAVEFGVPEHSFERARRKTTGGFLRMIQSPEAANEWLRLGMRGWSLFDVLDHLDALTADEAWRLFRQAVSLDDDRIAMSVVETEGA